MTCYYGNLPLPPFQLLAGDQLLPSQLPNCPKFFLLPSSSFLALLLITWHFFSETWDLGKSYKRRRSMEGRVNWCRQTQQARWTFSNIWERKMWRRFTLMFSNCWNEVVSFLCMGLIPSAALALSHKKSLKCFLGGALICNKSNCFAQATEKLYRRIAQKTFSPNAQLAVQKRES